MHYAIEHERKIQPRFDRIRNYKYRRQDDKKDPAERQSELGTRRAIFGPGGPVSSILLSLGRARLPPHFSSPILRGSEIAFSKMQERRERRKDVVLYNISLACIEMCNEDRMELFIYLSFRFIRNFFYRQVIRIRKVVVDRKGSVTSFFYDVLKCTHEEGTDFRRKQEIFDRESGSRMIDSRLDATRRPVCFSIKQHQTFCFHSIASPTNTINQFAAEFVAIAKRGWGGESYRFLRCIVECSLLRVILLHVLKGDFVLYLTILDESRAHGSSLLYPVFIGERVYDSTERG